jgi:hypothetical protein
MKFKLPKKLRQDWIKMVEESGGIDNLPNTYEIGLDEAVDNIMNATKEVVELGWANQDELDNMELVKFTNLKEHEMFEGKIPDNVVFLRCENRNDEFAHIIVSPGDKGYEVFIFKAQDNEFGDRVAFHTQEMGFLEAVVNYLINKVS